jgi:hypothetical protein
MLHIAGATAFPQPSGQGQGHSNQSTADPPAWEQSEGDGLHPAPCGWTLGGGTAAPLPSAEAQASARAFLQEPASCLPRAGPPGAQVGPSAWEQSEDDGQQLAPCGWTLGGGSAAPLASAKAQASTKAVLQEPVSCPPHAGPPGAHVGPTEQRELVPDGEQADGQHNAYPKTPAHQRGGRWDSQDDGTVGEAPCGWTTGAGKTVPPPSHEAQQRARGVLQHAADSPEPLERLTKGGQPLVDLNCSSSTPVMGGSRGLAEPQSCHAESPASALVESDARHGAFEGCQTSSADAPGKPGRLTVCCLDAHMQVQHVFLVHQSGVCILPAYD